MVHPRSFSKKNTSTSSRETAFRSKKGGEGFKRSSPLGFPKIRSVPFCPPTTEKANFYTLVMENFFSNTVRDEKDGKSGQTEEFFKHLQGKREGLRWR